jgi:hypothetical protein
MRVKIEAQLDHAQIHSSGMSRSFAVEKWNGSFASSERHPVRLYGPDGALIGQGYADVRGSVTVEITDDTVAEMLTDHTISALSIGEEPVLRRPTTVWMPAPTEYDHEVARELTDGKPLSQVVREFLDEQSRRDHEDGVDAG